VGNCKTSGQLLSHRGEHLGRRHRTCDQRRDASQCSLLVGEHANSVPAFFGLPAAPICFGGAQSGLAREDIGQQRDRHEDDDRYPVLSRDGEDAPVGVEMNERVDKSARHRRRHRQSESPAGRDHENTEQEDNTKGHPRKDPLERVRQNCLRNDEGCGDRDADSERWGRGAH
jgi:hypothetical protein